MKALLLVLLLSAAVKAQGQVEVIVSWDPNPPNQGVYHYDITMDSKVYHYDCVNGCPTVYSIIMNNDNRQHTISVVALNDYGGSPSTNFRFKIRDLK